jgi:aspartate kinase
MKVSKFGGTSLSSKESVLKARDIVQSDAERTFVVVSAPGKRFKGDKKVTDLLIDGDYESVWRRFLDLAEALGIDLNAEIAKTKNEVSRRWYDHDFIVSRGEYLMSVLFARVAGYEHLDAADFIVIKRGGLCDIKRTRKNFAAVNPNGRFVMGGFYGRGRGGAIRTFPRGGSDYTGAVVAAVMPECERYEVFTDTYGVCNADPNLYENARTITDMSYETLHIMAKNGAQVVFANCVPLLKKYKIPMLVDNTFDAGKTFTSVHI